MFKKKKDEFFGDEQLVTIVNNYSKQNKMVFGDLEMMSIMFYLDPHVLAKAYHTDKTDYAIFLGKAFYSSYIDYDSVQIAALRRYLEDTDTYKNTKSLFDLLIKQRKIVVDSTNSELVFYAFCYFCHCNCRLNMDKDLKLLIETYKIDLENNLNDALIKMSKVLGETATIGMYIFYFCNHNDNLFITCSSRCSDYVKRVLADNQQKEELDALLSGNNVKRNVRITDTDLMSGEAFEELIMKVLTRSGYSCSLTKKTGDQGVDIIASKDYEKIAVQCKCYNNTVGNHAIMEAFAGSKYYKCNKAMVVTNNYFTKGAVELAKTNGVILWDRDELEKRL